MKKIKVLGVIPARYDSSRLPGKVLAEINGKPMIWHVWNRAKKSRLLDKLIIATNDKKIYDVCVKFGAETIITSNRPRNGTERVAEAASLYKPEYVVNIQADEPMISPKTIDKLIITLKTQKSVDISTPVTKLKNKQKNNPNIVKVITDKNGYALYFSRTAIPYGKNEYLKHIGVYAYKYNILMKLIQLKQTKLEKIEKLEQLRFIEAGFKIKTVKINQGTISVDTPADLRAVRLLFKKYTPVHF